MPSGSNASRTWSFRGRAPCALLLAVLEATYGLASTHPAALAQPPPVDAAEARVRALFEEGVAFVDREEWDDAESRFRKCLEIRRSPVIEYNLASALEAQGELAEASDLFRSVLAQPSAPPALRSASGERLARLEPRLAHVTVVLASARAGAVVSIDGRPIPPERVGVPIPIDPGRHQVSARDRRSEAAVAIEAAEGMKLDVELALRAPSPAEAAAAAEPARAAAEPIAAPISTEAASPYRKPWVWLGISGAVVGLIVATAFLAQGDAADDGDPTRGPAFFALEVER